MSVKDEFENIPDQIGRGIAILVFALGGTGKTTLAGTLPVGSTLFISCEAGTGPLLGSGHVQYDLIKSLHHRGDNNIQALVEDLYSYLRTEDHPFENVVIDNMSELEQQLLMCLCKKRGKTTPDLREYGESSFIMKKWSEDFRDLVFQGINVVFNAWEFPLEIKNIDGNIVTKTFPQIGKRIAPQVCGIMDIVAHLEVHEKSGKRWLRVSPSDQYACKHQFKGLDPLGEIPDLPNLISKIMAYDYTKKEPEEVKDGNE